MSWVSICQLAKFSEERSFRSILVLLGLLLFNVRAIDGQQRIRPVSNLTSDYPAWVGRIVPFSTASPITQEIKANETLQEKLRPVYEFIQDVAGVVETRKNRSDTRACNLFPVSEWTKNIWQWMEVFQIGKVDRSCYTQVDVSIAVHNKELSSSYLQNTRQIFTNARQAYQEATKQIDGPKNANWSNPDAPYGIVSRVMIRDGQRCSVESIFAYKRGTKWYLRTESTNADPTIGMPDYGRQYLHEFIPSDFRTALQMPLPENGVDGDLQMFTTVITKWRGTGYSVEQQLFDDPVGALSRAYRQNLVTVDLAKDTITASNIAILALPMAMNFIPVAFVADLNSFGMFIYVIVTDIISTVPFFIKGVELVLSSNPQNQVVLAFYAGNTTLAAMQAWAVDCSGDLQFRTTGIVFVAVAVVILVVGLILEIWAKHRMDTKRANAKKGVKIDGPFGAAALETTSFALLGATESRLDEEYRTSICGSQHDQHNRVQSNISPSTHTGTLFPQNRFEKQKRRFTIRNLWFRQPKLTGF